MTRRRLIAIVAVGALLTACGEPEPDIGIELTEDQAQAVVANAINNNGWTDVDPEEWHALATDACFRGAWDHDINADMVDEFLSSHGWHDREHADQMPLIIWLNLHIVCHDLVPDEATAPPGAIGG